jgi:carboxyl-terminal processing protease
MQYETVGGRTVYGGGGVMPDIFIPRDTSGITSYYTNVVNSGTFYQFALEYSDRNRQMFSAFNNWNELYEYLKSQPLLNELINYAASKGIKRRPNLMEISGTLMERQLQAYIVRSFFAEEGFFQIFLKDDITFQRAVEVLKEGKALPITQFIKQSVENGNFQSKAGSEKRYGLSKERIFFDMVVRSFS